MKTLALTPWAYADAVMLGSGGYAPLRGFMTAQEYSSVLHLGRLPDGEPWGLPVILPVSAVPLRLDSLELHWQGRSIGTLHITDTFSLRPDDELEFVYGTRDTGHPGVAALSERPLQSLSGLVELHDPLRHSPAAVRTELAAQGWGSVAGFQTRNPLHRGHEKLLEYALTVTDGLLLHPLTGPTKADDVSVPARLASYEVSMNYLPPGRVLLRPYPAAMRYAGPREALTHAVSRRNYGVTHFLIGRDHAGIGSYYAPDAAQTFLNSFAETELGVKLLPMPEVVYCTACQDVILAGHCPHGADQHEPISGTRIRQGLAGGAVPSTLFRADVAQAIRNADLEPPSSR